MKQHSYQNLFKIISTIGLLCSVILCVYGWRSGVFTSQEKLQELIDGFGIAGPFVFILFQIVQVIIPILPGGVSCLAGVVLFGAWKGLLYNYIGICIDSVFAFLIARYYGRPILYKFFSDKMIQKYDKITSKNGSFSKWFALAIFLPVAPDDFLCYLAGTTEMSLRKFTTTILLCKPFAISLYSLGLAVIFSKLIALINH
jgi:Uncharacterized conserved protein